MQLFQRDYWVDSVAGSDANDGSAGAPFQTLGHALRAARPGERVEVHLVGGETFPLAGPIDLPAPLRLRVSGDYGDVGALGVRAVGPAGSSLLVVADAAGGLVPNGSQGARLTFLTGANAGRIHSVRANDAGSFTGFVGLPVAPAPGDQFVVERPLPTIAVPAGGFALGMHGAVVELAGVRLGFQGVGTFAVAQFAGGALLAQGLEVDLGASEGTLGLTDCRATLGAALPGAAQAFAVADRGAWAHGCYVHAAAPWRFALAVRDGGALYAFDTLFADAGLDALLGADATLNGFEFRGGAGLIVEHGARAFLQAPQDFASSSAFGGGAAALAQKGAYLKMLGVAMAGSAGDAVTAIDATAVLGQVTGSGWAGVGVRLRRGARLVSDGGGNTVAGAGGAVAVGGNAAASTWAAVDGGTVTDLGAATPQLCVAGPA